MEAERSSRRATSLIACLSGSGACMVRGASRLSLRMAVLVLTGCASPSSGGWVKQGASDQEFYADRGQCIAQAFTAPSTFQQQAILIGCMQGKGWHWVER